jgi:FAD/FMN-containing dehydrogenase
MWGLTLDHIMDMEDVLADGTITRANQDQNPDLFWVRLLCKRSKKCP